MNLETLLYKIRKGEGSFWRKVKGILHYAIFFDFPAPRFVFRPIYELLVIWRFLGHIIVEKVLYVPVFNLLDQNHYSVFNTSPERLGHGPFSMSRGDSLNLNFDLWSHLAQGAYYLGAYVKRYDFEKGLDTKFQAVTITVDSKIGVSGTTNLYPIFRVKG